ncbi:hypothetical protein AMJ50_02485 [Parcubacteria bacterium DG_74_3]|nr:MAG: hypothetical protein AMJ50_02485 [Parcubacteria bacterium DG_74_3]
MKGLKFHFVFLFFVVFTVVLLGRLFFIQIVQGDFYKALAEGLHFFPGETSFQRGEIFFKNGEPLAINKKWQLAWAHPLKIKEKEEFARKVSEILEMPEGLILEKIRQEDALYVMLKNKLTDKELENLRNLNLEGLNIDEIEGRYYPQEFLASKVVGFFGGEETGQYGIEQSYNEVLTGGNNFDVADLVLTLDYKIQFMAEKLLTEAQENLGIESGQIIVIEPYSGKILAIANFPNFNPNQYQEFATQNNLAIFQNDSTQKIFEPGSVLKSITFAAALNEDKITQETTYVDKGVVNIGGWPIYNYAQRIYDLTSMSEVLEKSINTGAVFVEQKLGHTLFLKYLEKFGFFEKTGIDLEETFSENKEFKKGYEVNFATASFGQGIEMTPIQLIRAYCAIANGGKLIHPFIVEKILKEEKVIEIEPEISSVQIISQKTSRQLTAMLVNVVEEGFARTAKIPGYYIAGKTGTALIPWSSLGKKESGYSEETWQSFIGWFPAFNPKVLILVKLDRPETKTAEYSAVPIFNKLAQYLINYQQIPPDYE